MKLQHLTLVCISITSSTFLIFSAHLSETITGMIALSEDCLGKINKSELVALVSGLQYKMDLLKSIFFNEIIKLNENLVG